MARDITPRQKKFVQEYGGTIVRMADIKPEMVDLRGGANTDDRM